MQPTVWMIVNAVDLLTEQHHEVDRLFARFETSKRRADKEKIFLELAARLVGHDVIERELFYPACERALGKSEPLIEGIAEHGLIEYSLFRADRALGTDSFDYLVSVLKELVEHHVEEEEAELFAAAARRMGDDMLEALGRTMRDRFAASIERDYRKQLRQSLAREMGLSKTGASRGASGRARRRSISRPNG